MLGADLSRQRGHDRVGVLAGLALRGHALAQVDHVVAHRGENLRTADVAVTGNNDRGFPTDELGEDLRPARTVDARVIRRKQGKDREDTLLGEVAGEEDALLRQPYNLVARGVGQSPGSQFDGAAAEIDR